MSLPLEVMSVFSLNSMSVLATNFVISACIFSLIVLIGFVYWFGLANSGPPLRRLPSLDWSLLRLPTVPIALG